MNFPLGSIFHETLAEILVLQGRNWADWLDRAGLIWRNLAPTLAI